ncbi:Aminoacyl-histidine_dipeptidase [Hexamita inflata]|uniref:Aminoacyl-histidine dipeptidase n=1 Tax=Hexamita inflata TaxID=28002 RepID=A0AA86QA04_9EUKA|nr:Aminoacyl-histidine dipeptidase [Hexamita inflata]
MKNLIVSILKENNIDYVCDTAHNIVGYIPATKNCQSQNILCLQAHYDMVFVSDNNQDAKTAQIIPRIDGEYLKATNTSLGADNCAGLASILALFITKLNGKQLPEQSFEHGAIELLFTADEEVGLAGAKNLSIPLKCQAMINTDCEDFHNIIIGSSGGDRKSYSKTIQLHIIPDNYCKLKLTYNNFIGGHTGFDLQKNRTNVSKMVFRTLNLLNCFILKLDIGQQMNSIPFNADVEIAVKQSDLTVSIDTINSVYKLFTQFSNDKGQLQIQQHILDINQGIIYQDIIELTQLEQGALILHEQYNVPSLSTSLTIVKLIKNHLSFSLLSRSNSALGMQFIQQTLNKLFKNYKQELSQFYNCWEPKPSNLLETVKQVYKDFKITIVHAGYETSYLVQNGIEAVSIGPEIHNPHSVHEELHIGKFIEFTEDLKEIVKEHAK